MSFVFIQMHIFHIIGLFGFSVALIKFYNLM